MADLPRVSVVMPSLNQGRFIRTAIDSVLDQKYPDLELLVIDGQSTDDTLAVLRSYGDRIRWVSEPDAGQVPALNKGFRMVSGDVIGWLNADDLYLPGAVAAAVAYFEQAPEVDLVYGDADHIDETGRVLAAYPTESFSLARLRYTCYICQPAALFRRRVFDTVGLLDERMNCSMDYDYWIRIAQRGRVEHLRTRLAQSRLHPTTKTSRLRLEHQRASVEIVKRHFGNVPPSWLCSYAAAVVEPWVPRRHGWQDACFKAAVTVVSVWASLRVNRCVPREALRDWFGWLGKARG